MTRHSMRLIAATVSAMIAASTAAAHVGHDDEEGKLMPSTCAHLADPARYVTDLAYPEVEALKTRCDAEKKSTDATTKKPAQTPADE